MMHVLVSYWTRCVLFTHPLLSVAVS